MKKDEIRLDDLNRILFGSTPHEYLIEIVIRTVCIYIFFLVIMWLLGKRMKGQMTILELAVIITLGAIIAPSMQLPERGIAHALFLLACILIFHRSLAALDVKSRKVERLTQGKLSILVKDGIIQLEALKSNRISKSQLFAIIRNKQIFNLGKVERLYLEPSGIFSLYEAVTEKPGLCVLPDSDPAARNLLNNINAATKACTNCGNTINEEFQHLPCTICAEKSWDSTFI